MRKQKGFTLIEILIAVAIGTILLGLVTGRLMRDTANVNKMYKSLLDVRTGVTKSMDMVMNTLKESDQIYLVGKEVYDPDLEDDKIKNGKNLDDHYSYIAFQNVGNGNRRLVNIVSKGFGKGFDIIPISASDDKDTFKNAKVFYNIELYPEKDKNGNDITKENNEKLSKNILNIQITGDVDADGKNDEYSLRREVALKNVNKILFSEYMKGDASDFKKNVTAIAYRTKEFAEANEEKKPNYEKVGIAMAVSDSMYMKGIFGEDEPFPEQSKGNDNCWYPAKLLPYGESYQIDLDQNKYYYGTANKIPYKGDKNMMMPNRVYGTTIRETVGIPPIKYNPSGDAGFTLEQIKSKYTTKGAILGKELEKFIKSLSGQADSLKIDTEMYMFQFNNMPKCNFMANRYSNPKYVYPLVNLKTEYSMYNLRKRKKVPGDLYKTYEDAIADLNTELNLDLTEDTIKRMAQGGIDYSNIGEAMLQQLDILNQMPNNYLKYLIIIVDRIPNSYTYSNKDDKTGLITDIDALKEAYKDNKNIMRRGLDDFGLGEDADKTEKKAVEYINDVVKKNFKQSTCNHAFVISFDKPGSVKNLNYNTYGNTTAETVEKILKLHGAEVTMATADSASELEKALENVSIDIKQSILDFRGPEPSKEVQKRRGN